MKAIYQDLPPADVARRKLVGRVVFGLLMLVAALVGATAGLLLVYSTDLPQVEQLEHYRPSSITELYDGRGRIIGSFALQRRVVASYNDYPQVLRDALISIEDKDFYQTLGYQCVENCRRGLPRHSIRREGSGRIDSHHATCAQPVSLA